jgi:1-phosphofructokinase family hexose kinase
MIVTLTPNPALDLTYHLDELPLGDVGRVAPAAARAGGKGLNVARVLHQQGLPVHAVTTAGGATGEALAADLPFPHTLVPVAGETRRSIALVEPGRTTVLNETGVPLTPDEMVALLAAARTIWSGALVVSGSLPPGFPAEALAELAGPGRLIVDTTGPGLLAACRAGAALVKPNRAELAATTGTGDLLTGAHALLAEGAGTVVVSDGERGLVAVSADRVLRARPDHMVAGNPTGAGDAVVAALAAAVPDEDLATTLDRAVRWSARAVAHPQAGELADIDVVAIIEEDPC